MTKASMLAATCSLSAVSWALLAAAPASAQSAPAQPGAAAPVQQVAQADTSATSGEIIVMARKRQESILNVPVVETAIPQKQLEQYQTQDLKDVAVLTPGLSLGDSILSIGTQVSIRGIGTTAYDPGIDQSVSLNIDGMQLSQGLAYASAFFDMQQVEVLKGPQSLFYGKSNTGGVISVRTADPTNEFEVIGRGGYEFEAQEKQGQIIISGPVTDTLKLRLATQYDSMEGFYNNGATGLAALGGQSPTDSHIGASNGYMIRGTALWNPTAQFSARLKLNQDFSHTEYGGAQEDVYCPGGTGPAALYGIQFLSPSDACRVSRNIYAVGMVPADFPGGAKDGVPFLDSTQTYGTLELNYKLTPELTLSSTTGYYLLHSSSYYNTSGTGYAGPELAVTNGFHRREWTEEVRASSDFSGPFNFTLGAYFERGQFSDLVDLIPNASIFENYFGFNPGPTLERGMHIVDIDSNSVFAQLRYKILPQLELAAGARYTDETRNETGIDYTTGTAINITEATPKLKSDTLSPELTLTYKPTTDMTIFGALKRGFKSGSFNVATPPTPDENNAFGDEKAEGGEFGLKSRWFERRLLFNIAAYSYRYTGLQVGAIIPVSNSVPVTRTINAGSALTTGIESDVSYRVPQIEGLTLHGAFDVNHAQFKKLDGVPCYGGQTIAAGCNETYSAAANSGLGGYSATNESGLPLVRAPKWQVNFGFDYERPIGHGMLVRLASNTQYSSKYLTGLGEIYYQKAFFKTDMNVTLEGPQDRWEFALIGKNLNNALTSGNCTNENGRGGLMPGTESTGTATTNGVDNVACWMDRGREVWLRLTLKPFGH